MSARIKLKKIWKIICEKDSSGYTRIAPYIFSNQPSDEDSAYTGTSGRRFRKHPDTKPEVSGHFAG